VEYLPKFRAMVQRPMQPMFIARDKLAFGRFAFVFFGIIALASYAAFAIGSLAIRSSGQSEGALLLALGCALFAVRAIWPAMFLGTRLMTSALVEIVLRFVVIAVFGVVALLEWPASY